jgi:selenide,water dikinase
MRQYQQLPEMNAAAAPAGPAVRPDNGTLRELRSAAMRCGGCGAKVGSDVLARVLRRIEPTRRNDLLVGLDAPDDAAVVEVPAGRVCVQTVDFFRAIVSDPFLFGRIAANHCLNDIFAMGAEPQTALALAVLPHTIETRTEEQLFQVMSGAVAILNAHRIALAGGHTGEGAELAFGLMISGLAEPARLWRKQGLRPGDALVLTKPIGTGTLFAADMRRQARGRWIAAALEMMLQSNHDAARCLREHGVTACTDVSGFGLLGHLLEMARASCVAVQLSLSAIPLLPGAGETVRAGVFSSLQPQNLRLKRAVQDADMMAGHPSFPLLFDPQTSGGLLAALPAERAPACVADLRKSGYGSAAEIGRVLEPDRTEQLIRLRD